MTNKVSLNYQLKYSRHLPFSFMWSHIMQRRCSSNESTLEERFSCTHPLLSTAHSQLPRQTRSMTQSRWMKTSAIRRAHSPVTTASIWTPGVPRISCSGWWTPRGTSKSLNLVQYMHTNKLFKNIQSVSWLSYHARQIVPISFQLWWFSRLVMLSFVLCLSMSHLSPLQTPYPPSNYFPNCGLSNIYSCPFSIKIESWL